MFDGAWEKERLNKWTYFGEVIVMPVPRNSADSNC